MSERLYNWMKDRWGRQTYLVKRLGVSRSTIAKWASGDRVCGDPQKAMLAEMLTGIPGLAAELRGLPWEVYEDLKSRAG